MEKLQIDRNSHGLEFSSVATFSRRWIMLGCWLFRWEILSSQQQGWVTVQLNTEFGIELLAEHRFLVLAKDVNNSRLQLKTAD